MRLTRRSFLGSIGTLPIGVQTLAAGEGATNASLVASPILLNSNENAYGPFAKVIATLHDSLSAAHRYPDRAKQAFIERVAKLHGVNPGQVILGSGSAEVLRLCAAAFTGPSRKLVMAAPTFELIGRLAEGVGAKVVKVPLAQDFSHDLQAMFAQAGQDTGLVYICNPNNPTASVTSRPAIEGLVAKLPALTRVLVDEAYHHFAAGSPSYVSLLAPRFDDERVIVSRTFSKIYGLAGMRIGYGIASSKTIEQLRRFSTAESTNVAALRGAAAALEDEGSLKAAAKRNAADRDEFIRQARSRKLAAIPSFANFAMIDVQRPVEGVIDHFKKQGILVGRPFPPMTTHLRVTFGLPSEMRKFWATWDALMKA